MPDMQELRQGRVPLLTNWDMDLCDPTNISCLCMWQVHSRYLHDKADSSSATLTAGWECGTRKPLARCLSASVAYYTVVVHRKRFQNCFISFLFSRFRSFCHFVLFSFRFVFVWADLCVSVNRVIIFSLMDISVSINGNHTGSQCCIIM